MDDEGHESIRLRFQLRTGSAGLLMIRKDAACVDMEGVCCVLETWLRIYSYWCSQALYLLCRLWLSLSLF